MSTAGDVDDSIVYSMSSDCATVRYASDDVTTPYSPTHFDEGNVMSMQSTSSNTPSSNENSSDMTQSAGLSVGDNDDANKIIEQDPSEYHAVTLPDTSIIISARSDDYGTSVPVEIPAAKSVPKTGVSEPIFMHAAAGGANSRETSDLAPSVYHVKWVKFCGTTTAIVMQNQNGPCPLLAIANILLLQAKIRLPSGSELVAADQLIGYIADFLFENVPKHITDVTRLNYEQNMHDAIAVFPRLQTGLDVNVRFTGVHDFEYTPECIVFDLLGISLVHGWLVDPEMTHVVNALGSCSYNQLVEKIIENKNSDKEELVTSALIAEEFLNSTASQLTYHGLCELSAVLKEDQLCVLFRNNHFSTLYRRKGELFTLVTDQGFLNEANVVWETQSNVEGDGHFVDANFYAYRLPELKTDTSKAATAQSTPFVPPPINSKEQIDHDYLVALSMEQDQGQVAGSDMWLDVDVATLSDHDIAVRLQREEELKAAAAGSAAPGSSTGSGISLPRQQKALSSSASTAGGSRAESGGAGVAGKDKKSDNCAIL